MQLTPRTTGHLVRPNDWLGGDLDRLVQQFFGQPFLGAPAAAGAVHAALDVSETEDEVLVRADVPGIAPEQIEITLDDGVLTICGEKRDEFDGEREGRRVCERRFGSFKRSLRLGAPIDESKVAAEHEHGVLTIRLPKQTPTKARRIDVKSN